MTYIFATFWSKFVFLLLSLLTIQPTRICNVQFHHCRCSLPSHWQQIQVLFHLNYLLLFLDISCTTAVLSIKEHMCLVIYVKNGRRLARITHFNGGALFQSIYTETFKFCIVICPYHPDRISQLSVDKDCSLFSI